MLKRLSRLGPFPRAARKYASGVWVLITVAGDVSAP